MLGARLSSRGMNGSGYPSGMVTLLLSAQTDLSIICLLRNAASNIASAVLDDCRLNKL